MRSRRKVLLGVMAMILMLTGLPAATASAVEPQTDAFDRTWGRTDQPVAAKEATRTWMWGPGGFTGSMYEPYAESPDGMREVQYFDKSRMEITNPNAVDDGLWYVTNGLLVVELVTGRMQLGDTAFVELPPAEVNVAGDPGSGPTYATFNPLQAAAALAEGTTITQRLNADGSVIEEPGLAARGIGAAHYVQDTNHTVAQPFWEFMNSSGTVMENGSYVTAGLFQNPFYATGLPITEAYWAQVTVGGTPKDVLVQCFERRCLTYTPDNPVEWRIEMGNVGQHYYKWRYGTEIPSEPRPADASQFDPAGPAPLFNWPAPNDGQSFVMIGNQSPYPMTVWLDGPTSQTMSIPGCGNCSVYSSPVEFDGCHNDIPWQEMTLPPGNYRVEISWSTGNVTSAAGIWTLVPDADYASCYFVVQQ